MTVAITDARAETVGSLLRPDYLLESLAARQTGAANDGDLAAAEELTAVEDRAVLEAIAMQEAAGLDIVSDGEMRRLSFQSQMTEAVSGFGPCDLDAFLWGDWQGGDGQKPVNRPRPDGLGVTGKLTPKRFLSAHEYSFLAANTARIPKITLPSPGLFANFYVPGLAPPAYPTLDAFIADVVGILSDEVRELARLGTRYIQIDAPHYPLLMQPKMREFYQSTGWDMEHWLARGIEADNAVIAAAPEVSFALHLCRGNQQGRWLAAGGYDSLARQVFGRTSARRLLLEYDDHRSGGFEPLAEVPDDKWVVLGLISTKQPALEDAGALCRRIDDAARYIGRERLAISPQCGFSSSILPGALNQTDQAAKLRLLVEVAKMAWG